MHGALLGATLFTVVADMALLALAVQKRWLGGTAFAAPYPELLLVYGTTVTFFLALPLAIHRELCRHSKRVAMLTYLLWVVAEAVVSTLTVGQLLSAGTFVFAGGYSTAWDTIWSVAQYVFAFCIYRYWRGSRG